MAEPESVVDAYGRVRPLVEELSRYVRGTLELFAKNQGYFFRDRIKGLDSLSEKLESGRYESWSELDDLYACTIVVPTSAHEKAVLERLDALFRRTVVRSRSDSQKAPDVFRFDGVRWYGYIQEDLTEIRQPGLDQLKFEVQVITAFEHAWVTVTHDLAYKGGKVDWKRQRLAAHLKAAVEQIEVLISAFDSASAAVLKSPWPASEAQVKIVDCFQALLHDGLVPATLEPRSWGRFANNVWSLVCSYQRNPNQRLTSVDELLATLDGDLRSGVSRPLHSGSLFQFVLSVVARPGSRGDLAHFKVVPSQELTLYGVRAIPRPFKFDGLALVASVDPALGAATD